MSSSLDIEPANPFQDPAGSGHQTTPEPVDEDLYKSNVLIVDRNATLTLGVDSLVVLDEGLRHRRAAINCCGLLPQRSKTTRAVPFYNVLWAELKDFEITIQYAQNTGKKSCIAATINYTISDKSLHAHAQRWVEMLMQRAYPPTTKRRKRLKVLVNPFGGQGYAQKLWSTHAEPIFAAAHCEVDVERTKYRGHAREIAEKLNVEAYDAVVCASGDGLPHEVFNGLAKQAHPRHALRKVAVVQLPCGSGNAMSLNLNETDSASLAALAIVKGVRTPMDLVAITQGDKSYYSFLSQAVGIVAEVDLGTDNIRWMGSFRFTWGFLVRLLGQMTYPAEVSVVLDSDDKLVIKDNYRKAVERHGSTMPARVDLNDPDFDIHIPALRYGTVQDPLHHSFQTQDQPHLGNFFVGKMCWMSPGAAFFRTALPNDGKMEMINISGLTSRLTAINMLTTAGDGGLIDFPEVSYRKVEAYRIVPRVAPVRKENTVRKRVGRWLGGAAKQRDGLIAIDGESVPFEPFQAEVIKGVGTVLSKSGGVYDSHGLKEI